MIGHRKFAWKVENLPPTEWFDLDREENIMEFDPETQPNTPIFDDEDDSENFGWQGCPQCKSMQAEHIGEVSRPDDRKTSSQWRCQDCGHVFLENNWMW